MGCCGGSEAADLNINNSARSKTIYKSIIPTRISAIDISVQGTELNEYSGPETINGHCHWLIPNIILCGKRPIDNKDKDLDKTMIDTLLNIGITHFVSLIGDNGSDEPSHSQVYNENIFGDNWKNVEKNLIHFAIHDFGVSDNNDDMVKLINNMIEIIINDTNNKIYIHCASGHGRTGQIMILVIQAIYRLSGPESYKFVNIVHKKRLKCGGSCHSKKEPTVPETDDQLNFVYKLENKMWQIYDNHVVNQ